MHCSASAFNALTTMRTARFAALYVLPSGCRREQGQSGVDAATGRTVSGIAVLWKPQFCRAAGTRTARTHQPKTRATTDAAHGHRGLVPEAESESSGSRTRDLSLSAPRCPGQPTQPGLEHRYHLSSDAIRVPLPGGHYGLVQPLRVELDLSNTLEVDFCRSALEEALRAGRCEIFNSDQGAQFTSRQFLQPLKDRSILISMDGRGRAMDNVFIERLWRSVKYELIYPGDFDSGAELWSALARYFDHYNFRRPHQALDYRTPAELYLNRRPKNKIR